MRLWGLLSTRKLRRGTVALDVRPGLVSTSHPFQIRYDVPIMEQVLAHETPQKARVDDVLPETMGKTWFSLVRNNTESITRNLAKTCNLNGRFPSTCGCSGKAPYVAEKLQLLTISVRDDSYSPTYLALFRHSYLRFKRPFIKGTHHPPPSCEELKKETESGFDEREVMISHHPISSAGRQR